jgi:hypothetical protein
MVADRHRDDRGQLLLVGGISIALVIVGGVILLNGMMFTNTIGSHGNQDAVSEAERTVETMENDLRRLTDRVRADTGIGEFRGAIERNLTVYTRQYTNLSFDNDIVYTDAELNDTESDSGTFLNQTADADDCDEQFTAGTRLPTFEYYTDSGNCKDLTVGEISTLEQFNLTVRRLACQRGRPTDTNLTVHVNDSDDPTEYWNVRLAAVRTDGGSCNSAGNAAGDVTRYMEIYNSSDGLVASYSDSEPWFPESGRIRMDLRAGTVEGQSVPELDYTEHVSGPYDIKIRNRDGGGGTEPALGTYRLWSDGSPPSDLGSQPSSRTALTTLAVDITYQRPELRYERTIKLNGTG